MYDGGCGRRKCPGRPQPNAGYVRRYREILALMLWLVIKGAKPPSAGRRSLVGGGWLGRIAGV